MACCLYGHSLWRHKTNGFPSSGCLGDELFNNDHVLIYSFAMSSVEEQFKLFLSIYVVCGTFQCHSLYCSFMWNVTIDSLVNHSIIDICGLYYSILPFCFRILVNVCSILYIYLTSLSTLRPELPFNANASVNEAQKNLIERDCRFIHFSMAFSFFYLTLIYINCLLHHYHHHLFLLLGNCFRLRND